MQRDATVETERTAEGRVTFRLAGDWLAGGLPTMERFAAELKGATVVAFDAREMGRWDSGLVALLAKLLHTCAQLGLDADREGLPQGVARLLALGESVPRRHGVQDDTLRIALVEVVGERMLMLWQGGQGFSAFLGEITLSMGRILRGKARFPFAEFASHVQDAGAMALPIVSLISILVGLILAFVGMVQLKLFGAEIYVADLVGIGMVREMGAMMTGIIMAGRTGASYAARLGTMQVNEEIDALKTFGIDPVDFLVMPRLLAVTLMLPLLCAYADLMGVLGGAIVSVMSSDIGFVQYMDRTREAVSLAHFWVGIFKSFIYGAVVAIAGCLRGMQCGRSASAVGDATTSAVVTGIVWIVGWCAITTVIFQVLGI